MTRIAIHGAGSVGCFLGSVWSSCGLDITLIGRTYVHEVIEQNGITLTDYSGFKATVAADDIAFSNDASALATADIIALTVKSTGTAEAAKEIANYARAGTIVVSLQNGISNVDKLRKLLPEQIVLAGMVPYNVANLGNGHWHKGTAGTVMADRHPALQSIVDRAGNSPAAMKLKDDMPAIAWGKLLINLNNAVNALSGQPLLNELSQRDYRRVFAATIQEALGVLEAANITPAQVGAMPPHRLAAILKAPDFIFNYFFLRRQKIDARARSSMAEDFDANRKTEIDYLNGEVVALAKAQGLSAPYNSAVVELVKEAEAGGKQNWSAKELRKRVLGR